MSKAEELLNSLVEAYAAESDPSSDSHIVIGVDRFITVPDELKRIAVQYDHNMRTVTFDCPRYYDGRDMSKMTVYINIRGPKGAPHSYIADDLRVDTSNPSVMHFDWTIRRPITDVNGKLIFMVCIRKADSEGNEENHWNSELNTDLYISEGMEYAEFEEYPYSDIVTQLLNRMDAVEDLAGGVTDEQISTAVSDYLDKHPVTSGSTATIGTVELLASNWVASELSDRLHYQENVTITDIPESFDIENCQVDLTPSVEQLIVFYEKDLTFVTENEEGNVTVYAIGQKPEHDYAIQVTLTEVR